MIHQHFQTSLPALAAAAAAATTIELGPHAAACAIALANILAATLTTIVLQRCQHHLRQPRKKLHPPHMVLTRPRKHKVQKHRPLKASVIRSKQTRG